MIRAAEEQEDNLLNDEVNDKTSYIKQAVAGIVSVVILSGLLYYIFGDKTRKGPDLSSDGKCDIRDNESYMMSMDQRFKDGNSKNSPSLPEPKSSSQEEGETITVVDHHQPPLGEINFATTEIESNDNNNRSSEIEDETSQVPQEDSESEEKNVNAKVEVEIEVLKKGRDTQINKEKDSLKKELEGLEEQSKEYYYNRSLGHYHNRSLGHYHNRSLGHPHNRFVKLYITDKNKTKFFGYTDGSEIYRMSKGRGKSISQPSHPIFNSFHQSLEVTNGEHYFLCPGERKKWDDFDGQLEERKKEIQQLYDKEINRINRIYDEQIQLFKGESKKQNQNSNHRRVNYSNQFILQNS